MSNLFFSLAAAVAVADSDWPERAEVADSDWPERVAVAVAVAVAERAAAVAT